VLVVCSRMCLSPTSVLGIRIQWFHTWERSACWQEEVEWLQREAASTLLDFAHRRDSWWLRADESEMHGWSAFCHQQSAVWGTMIRIACGKLDNLLQVCDLLKPSWLAYADHHKDSFLLGPTTSFKSTANLYHSCRPPCSVRCLPIYYFSTAAVITAAMIEKTRETLRQ
jgi:hypothetical protein